MSPLAILVHAVVLTFAVFVLTGLPGYILRKKSSS
jgi:hypothetical protein